MEVNLIETWSHMNALVRGVVILLSLQALASIAVVVDKLIVLATGYRASRRFARTAGPLLASADFDGVLTIAKEKTHRKSHLRTLIVSGIGAFQQRRAEGLSRSKAVELAGRVVERKTESLGDQLNRGLNVLASTGSTAPFIGLLGTVLGILNAFRLLGQEGSGGIGTIGVAIAEALIVTGFGLMVAIPAVLAFNWLSGRIAKYEGVLANAGSELIDRFEIASAQAQSTPAWELPDAAPSTRHSSERSTTANAA